jgi:hypothetical protein
MKKRMHLSKETCGDVIETLLLAQVCFVYVVGDPDSRGLLGAWRCPSRVTPSFTLRRFHCFFHAVEFRFFSPVIFHQAQFSKGS